MSSVPEVYLYLYIPLLLVSWQDNYLSCHETHWKHLWCLSYKHCSSFLNEKVNELFHNLTYFVASAMWGCFFKDKSYFFFLCLRVRINEVFFKVTLMGYLSMVINQAVSTAVSVSEISVLEIFQLNCLTFYSCFTSFVCP